MSTSKSKSKLKSMFKDFTNEQKWVFLTLSIGYISMFCPGTLIAPLFPSEAEKHGASSSDIGLCFAMSHLMAVFASPFLGQLIAAIGPKFVIITGIVFNGAFSICFGLLEDVPVESTKWYVAGCFICMGLASFGGAAIYTATLTYIAKMFPDNMSLVVGMTEAYLAIAEIIALLSGGLIYDIGGFKLPFVLFGTLHLLVIPLDLILLPPDDKVTKGHVAVVEGAIFPPQEIPYDSSEKSAEGTRKCTVEGGVDESLKDSGSPLKLILSSKSTENLELDEKKRQLTLLEVSPLTLKNGNKVPDQLRLWHLIFIPRTMLMALVILVTGVSWSFFSSTLEPHLSPLNLTTTETNLMFLLTSVVYGLFSPLWGCVSDKMNRSWLLIIWGLTLASITYCFLGPLPFLGLQNTVWQNIICLIALTATLSAAGIPACEATILYTVEAGHKDSVATYAIVSSLISTMFSAGAAIGSFAGGHLLENFGYPTSAGLCGSVCFIWGIVILCYFLVFHNHPTPRNKSASDSDGITGRNRTSTGGSIRLSNSITPAHIPLQHLNSTSSTSDSINHKIIIELTTPTPTLRRKIPNFDDASSFC